MSLRAVMMIRKRRVEYYYHVCYRSLRALRRAASALLRCARVKSKFYASADFIDLSGLGVEKRGQGGTSARAHVGDRVRSANEIKSFPLR